MMISDAFFFALRTYLEEPENSKRRKELLAMWKYVVNSMTYEAGEKENKKSFEELKKNCRFNGCGNYF